MIRLHRTYSFVVLEVVKATENEMLWRVRMTWTCDL